MARILLFAATAINLIGTVVSANAQSRVRQTQLASTPRMAYAPFERRSGPPWAMPNACYIDEGFGRFSPCR